MTQCAVAILHYDNENYAATIALLTEVLQSASLPNGAPSRPYLHFYLGNSYVFERFGGPVGRLTQAIHEYDLALSDWTRENAPMLWASVVANRAIAMISGPMDENRVQDAIAFMDSAEDIFEAKRALFFLGILHINRSYAYRLKLTPGQQSNLEMAIGDADQALQIFKRENSPILWAKAMIARGAAYRDRVSGGRSSNLNEALRSADAALEVLRQGTYTWALAQNNRGAALKYIENGAKAQNLRAALECFNSALQVFNRKQYPQEWGMVMLNLGDAYSGFDGPGYARQAIVFYRLSLEVRDRHRYPSEWAETMRGLSHAYMLGPGPNRREDFKQAIRIAQSALHSVKREQNSWLWATLSRNIADSLVELGEQKKAKGIYDVLANQVLANQITVPYSRWAGTLFYNRANSCLELARQHDRELLLDAISSYERALAFVHEQDQPEIWGAIMHNKGMAYFYLPENGRKHIDNAVRSFDSALRVRSRDRHPREWATTMLSKGMALLALGTDEDRIAAIQCFEQSLQVFTKDGYPQQWRIATRLRNQALGGSPREPTSKAII